MERTAHERGLADGWRRGENDAVAEVYSRYFEDIYTYAKMALRDRHEAEDVAQLIFTKALEARGRFDPDGAGSLRTWLFAIARNAVADTMRKRSRLVLEEPAQLERRRDEDLEAQMTTLLTWVKDADLAIFLERLPDPQRDVLVLRYLIGLEPREVARALGKTERAAYDLHRRALATLESRLGAIGRRAARRRRIPSLTRIRPAPVLAARRFALRMRSFGGSRTGR